MDLLYNRALFNTVVKDNYKTWGKFIWHVLHLAAAEYSDTPTAAQKRKMSAFLTREVPEAIPCKEECVAEYKAYIKKSAPPVASRSALERWMYEFHNHITKIRLNRDSMPSEQQTRVISVMSSPMLSPGRAQPALKQPVMVPTFEEVRDYYRMIALNPQRRQFVGDVPSRRGNVLM